VPAQMDCDLGTPPGLIVERLPDGELLIYDRRTDAAHCLDADAARVWAGTTTGLSVEQVRATRARLAELGLIEPAGANRRELLLGGAKAAAVAAVAIPVIRTIAAPTAAQASSLLPSGSGCSSPAQCQSGLCNGGVCA
jgi:hypothetical protein